MPLNEQGEWVDVLPEPEAAPSGSVSGVIEAQGRALLTSAAAASRVLAPAASWAIPRTPTEQATSEFMKSPWVVRDPQGRVQYWQTLKSIAGHAMAPAAPALAGMRGLQVIPSAIAGRIATGRWAPLADAERLIYPEKFGEPHTMATVLGRLAEAKTHSPYLGQAAALGGFAADVLLGLDVIAGHAVSFGGTVTRGQARAVSGHVVDRAVGNAVRDGVVQREVGQAVAGTVAADVRDAIMEGAKQQTRSGRWAFEPQDLAQGSNEAIQNYRSLVGHAVRKVAPGLERAAEANLTARIVGALQHEFTEGTRVRVPLPGMNKYRLGRPPTRPRVTPWQEKDVAQGLRTAEKASGRLSEIVPEFEPAALSERAEEYRQAIIQGLETRRTTAEAEIASHHSAISRLVASSPDEVSQRRQLLQEQITQAQEAERQAATELLRAERSGVAHTEEQLLRLADEVDQARLARQKFELQLANGGTELPDHLALDVPDVKSPLETLRASARQSRKAWERIRPALLELYQEKRQVALRDVNASRRSYTARARALDPDVDVLAELLHGKNRRLPTTAADRIASQAERSRSPLAELHGLTWKGYARETSEVSARRLAQQYAAKGNPDNVIAVLLHSSATLTRSKIDRLIANIAAGRMDWVQEFYSSNKVPDWVQEIFHERLGEITDGAVTLDYAGNPAASRVALRLGEDSVVSGPIADVMDDIELTAEHRNAELIAAHNEELIERALDEVTEKMQQTQELRSETLEAFDEWAKTAQGVDPDELGRRRQQLYTHFQDELQRLDAERGRIHGEARAAARGAAEQSSRPSRAAVTPRAAHREATSLSEKVQRGYQQLVKAAAEDPKWREKLLGPVRQREESAVAKLSERARRPLRSEAQTERVARARDKAKVMRARARTAHDELQLATEQASPGFHAIEQGILRSLPRYLRSSVDETIEELRAKGVPVTPAIEGRLRTVAIRQLQQQIDRLQERIEIEADRPWPEMMARQVSGAARAEHVPLMRPDAKGLWQHAKQYVVQGARLEKAMVEDFRNTMGKAFGDYARRQQWTNRIFESRGLTMAEREAITIAHDLMYPHYLKRALGEAEAGTTIAGSQETALRFLLNRLAPEAVQDPSAYADAAANLAVAKLPRRVRTAWEAMEEWSALQYEQFLGSDRLKQLGLRPHRDVINELVDHANPLLEPEERPYVGDLGPGYALMATMHNADLSEIRRILEGTQPEVAQLMKNALEQAEIDQAADARVLDHFAQQVAAGHANPSTEVPRLDAWELSHALNLKTRRNEQMLAVYEFVKRHFEPSQRLGQGEAARRIAAGWKPLEWSPGDLVRGLEDYLVPPALQAEIISQNPAWEGPLGIFFRLSGRAKPAVLMSGSFAGAQVEEQISNALRAMPAFLVGGMRNGTHAGLRGWRFAMAALARDALDSFAVVPPKTGAEGLVQWAATFADRVSSAGPRVIDEMLAKIAPHATARRLREYEEILQRNLKVLREYPVHSGTAGQIARETYTSWNQVFGKWMNQASTLGTTTRVGKQVVGKLVSAWFAADTIGRTALEIGLRESGESPGMARQILRTLSVEYGPEMHAPFDRVLQQTFWFVRYQRHRAEQFAHLAKANPGLFATGVGVARNWPRLQGTDDETQTLLAGRPGWVKSSVEYWPVSFSLPWVEPFDPEKFPAVQAVEGDWVVYQRMRDPLYESASDVLDWLRPGQEFLGNLPPPARTLWSWLGEGQSFGRAAESLPVVGTYLRAHRQLDPAPADKLKPGETPVRPPYEPDIAAAARASKKLWKENPELARQYEVEKTEMLRRIRAMRRVGVAMTPVFVNECLKNLTPAQLRKLRQYHNVPGHGYVPLPLIDEQLEKRERGIGPSNQFEQLQRRW